MIISFLIILNFFLHPVLAQSKKIALTFDADLTPYMLSELKAGKVKSWYNSNIITLLQKTKTPATLFLTGMWAEEYPEVTKSLAQNSLFEIANHSYSHPGFHQPCYGLGKVSEADKKSEIQKTQDVLQKLTNQKPSLFRFPGGCAGPLDIKLVEKMGLKVINWDISSGDAFNSNPQKIIRQVLNNLKDNAIVVFHLNGGPNAPATASALKTLLPILHQKGYTAVKVSGL